jgi:hypothetical protein
MMRERDIRALSERVFKRLDDDNLSTRERSRWEGVLTALEIILGERAILSPQADAWIWALGAQIEAKAS